jgi:ABC-2 type transport system ATP-binding protein
MIETINLTKKYGELIALNNLNLTIEDGDCFGFIGPNGAGKTTTIKILGTLLKPTWGEARIDGKVIGYQNPQIRPIIGYVPDFMGAYDDMVVSEYLEFFAACYDIHGKQRERVVRDVLDLTDLNYKANAEVNGLSRGMKQRLSIARVLLHDPKVLLLDEPASGLVSGPVSEIMARASMGKVVHITVDDRVEEAARLLVQVKGITKVDMTNHNGTIRLDVTIDPESGLPISELPNRLIAQGFRVSSLQEEQVNLETAFMRLTKGLVS